MPELDPQMAKTATTIATLGPCCNLAVRSVLGGAKTDDELTCGLSTMIYLGKMYRADPGLTSEFLTRLMAELEAIPGRWNNEDDEIDQRVYVEFADAVGR